jgi:hypothetical protein
MDLAKQFPAPIAVRDQGKSYYKFNLEGVAVYPEIPRCSIQQLKTSFVSACAPAIMSKYLLEFYGHFLTVHAKRFAKPYTAAELIKATKHFAIIADEAAGEEDIEWKFTPLNIEARDGFNMYWTCTAEEPKIELFTGAPEVAAVADSLEEAALDDLPQGSTEFLRLTSDSQLRERRSIEEARIRAKWAQYKAEKAIAKYVEKYGEFDDEFLSDDDDSESDDSE